MNCPPPPKKPASKPLVNEVIVNRILRNSKLNGGSGGEAAPTAVPGAPDVLQWQAAVNEYERKTSLTIEEKRLVLRYLQVNAMDVVTCPPKSGPGRLGGFGAF